MAFRFDRQIFFERYRKFEGPLTSQQVAGLNFLLDAVEMDRQVVRLEWFAYMLATTKHETADTYQPIHEYGGRSYFIRRYGSQTAVGRRLGNDTAEEGAIYAGRGDVQLTGETNYERSEAALRREYPELVADFERRTGRVFDLTVGDQPGDHRDPDNAADPAIAYAIMSFGMRTGLFTSKKLVDFTTPDDFDELRARKIINGMDKADLIASYYAPILRILRASLIDDDDMLSISEIEQLTESIGPVSTEQEPAGSTTGLPEQPATNTVEEPEPEAVAGPGAVTGEGDAPDAEPSSWLNVEDWKDFSVRWLKRIWGVGVTGNVAQAATFVGAAVKDPERGHIYLGIGAAIFVVVAVIGLLLSAGLVGLLWWNRKEIGHYITEQWRAKMDPNRKNFGLIFEKK